jgi:hypothetical protein
MADRVVYYDGCFVNYFDREMGVAVVAVKKVISARSHLRTLANAGRIGWQHQRAIRGSPTGRAATALPRACRAARSGRRSEKLDNGGRFWVFDRDRGAARALDLAAYPGVKRLDAPSPGREGSITIGCTRDWPALTTMDQQT